MTLKTVKICIACGSTDISIPPAGIDFGMSLRDYCQECHAKGNFPTIPVDEVEGYRKQVKENQ
jgi:hypothetical protein